MTVKNPKKKQKISYKIVVHFLGRVLCLVHCYFYDLVPMGFGLDFFWGGVPCPQLRANFCLTKPKLKSKRSFENWLLQKSMCFLCVLSLVIGWHCPAIRGSLSVFLTLFPGPKSWHWPGIRDQGLVRVLLGSGSFANTEQITSAFERHQNLGVLRNQRSE